MKFILYKFFETEQYRNDFLNGILFSNKFSYYREKENQISGVCDDFENASIIAWADESHFTQQRIITDGKRAFVKIEEYDKKPENYIDHQGFISFDKCDYNVFCMSSIILNDDCTVSKFDKAVEKDFGDKGIIVRDTNAFLQRIKDSISNNSDTGSIQCGFVTYINYDKRDTIQHWSPFNKFDSFSHQQEYRFVFNSKVNDVLKYKIESLRDICFLIDNKAQFFHDINIGEQISVRSGTNEI